MIDETLVFKFLAKYSFTSNSLWLPYERFRQCLDQALKGNDAFRCDVADYSEEGREILKLSWGRGQKILFIWSQMHGDESTGTWGILDLIAFLKTAAGRKLEDQVQLVILPMVNPDGAEAFTRRTASGIDMNRDARALQSAGMNLLQRELLAANPTLALNLHDQRSIFGAGGGGHPAVISFLNPSGDRAKSLTDSRVFAMRVIALQATWLQQYIPQKIGRYSDAFYPTAIGEWAQEQNIPCILIESGWEQNDPEKLIPRKCHLPIFIAAINGMLSEKKLPNEQVYYDIPENADVFFDLIAETTVFNGELTNVNSGFMKRYSVNSGSFHSWWEWVDFGDLSFKHAHQRIDVVEVISEAKSFNTLENKKVSIKY
jgi:hypothetical protein